MLLQFSFKNYRSFSDETVLDFRASGSNELPFHLRQVANSKVLPIIAIYGANASGKSNTFHAFEFMQRMVTMSYLYNQKLNDERLSINGVTSESNSADNFYYLFQDDSMEINKNSEFEVDFILQDKKRPLYVNYGFVLNNLGITEEWLRVNYKTRMEKNQDYYPVFHRIGNKISELNSEMLEYKQNIDKSIDNNVLLLTMGAVLKIEELSKIRSWFMKNTYLDCSIRSDDMRLRLINEVSDEDRIDMLNFLRVFDKSIVDLKFKKTQNSTSRYDRIEIFTVHCSEKNTVYELPIAEESAGTRKMLSLYHNFRRTLDFGAVMFVDELDNKLHPLLMRNILLSFADPDKNPRNAQLVFTTHNTVYLDMNLLRRDEIWFTEKTDNKSELYSLIDIVDSKGNKFRKDSDYEKNYLLGSFGAIPKLSPFIKVEKYEE